MNLKSMALSNIPEMVDYRWEACEQLGIVNQMDVLGIPNVDPDKDTRTVKFTGKVDYMRYVPVYGRQTHYEFECTVCKEKWFVCDYNPDGTQTDYEKVRCLKCPVIELSHEVKTFLKQT